MSGFWTVLRTVGSVSYTHLLYEDVCTALAEAGRSGIKVLAGRYGLSSKDTTPAQMKAVYDNMAGEQKNHFTVGIVDDVTHRSLDVEMCIRDSRSPLP